jgi:hypothetical protein
MIKVTPRRTRPKSMANPRRDGSVRVSAKHKLCQPAPYKGCFSNSQLSAAAEAATAWACSAQAHNHSTSRITLRCFIRSRACTTSFLSSTANRLCTVRAASRCPGSMYSPRMRLASSIARKSVSWSGVLTRPTPLTLFKQALAYLFRGRPLVKEVADRGGH